MSTQQYNITPADRAKMKLIKRLTGWDPTFERLSITKGAKDARVQVRNLPGEAINPAHVMRLAGADARGERLPAIVVTADNWIVDGSHTLFAELKNKRGEHYFIVLKDVYYEGADEFTVAQIKRLGQALNVGNGLPPNTGDAKRHALLILTVMRLNGKTELGDSDYVTVAAEVGSLTSRTVRNIDNGAQAEKRARSLNVDPKAVDVVSDSNWYRIGQTQTMNMSDTVFSKIVQVASLVKKTVDFAQIIEETLGKDNDCEREKYLDEEIIIRKASNPVTTQIIKDSRVLLDHGYKNILDRAVDYVKDKDVSRKQAAVLTDIARFAQKLADLQRKEAE